MLHTLLFRASVATFTVLFFPYLMQAGLVAQTNLVANGEFDEGLTGWEIVSVDGGQVEAVVVDSATISGEHTLRLTNLIAGPNLYSTGIRYPITVAEGSPAIYRVNFQARAVADRQIVFEFKVGETSLLYETQSLTPEVRSFTFEFRRTSAEPIELLFFTGIESPAVFIDAVSVTLEDAPAGIDGVVRGDHAPVAIGGGGYVTGVYYHPVTCEQLYMRTDVGGGFRYDFAGENWVPLFTEFVLGQENYYGVNALALAPSNDSVIYVAADKAQYFSGPSDLLVSRDRGATWTPTGLNRRFFGFGDFFSKAFGPAIAVDPTDADRLYAGTINSGLWYKADRNTGWEQVPEVPTGLENIGIKSVAYAPNGTVYVAVMGQGLYARAGTEPTFSRIPESPTDIQQLVIGSDGTIVVGTGDGVYIRDVGGEWRQELAGLNFTAVDVHPAGNGRVVALENNFGRGQGAIFYSEDGGRQWREIDYERQNFPPWQPFFLWANAGASISFDPCEEAAVSFSDFYAVWHTEDIRQRPSNWSTYSRGHEETYVTDVVSPPVGDRLYATLADVVGFSWEDDISIFPEQLISGPFSLETDPFLNNGTSVDYCPARPREKVAAANINNFGGQGYILRSADEFESYDLRPVPGSMGRVAMSATDPDNMVIVTQGQEESRVYYTTTGGEVWEQSAGAPTGLIDNMFRARQPLAADRVAASTFYVYENPGRLHKSTDGGANFTLINEQLPTSAPFDTWELKSHPTQTEEIWLSLDLAGLHRSVDGGTSFEPIRVLDRSYTFGFGVGRTPTSPPVVYVYGAAEGREGLYFSEDLGGSWVYVEMAINWVNNPRSLTGDGQDFGRVYIGSDGSGVLSVTLLDTDSTTSTAAATTEHVGTAGGIAVWPNPAQAEVAISLKSSVTYTTDLRWYDAAGRALRTQRIKVEEGMNQLTTSLIGLPAGLLTAVISAPDGPLSVQVVKQ